MILKNSLKTLCILGAFIAPQVGFVYPACTKQNQQSSPQLTASIFKAITSKMTYKQVAELMGFAGKLHLAYSKNHKAYVWVANQHPKTKIMVEFKDNGAIKKKEYGVLDPIDNFIPVNWDLFESIKIGDSRSQLQKTIGQKVHIDSTEIIFGQDTEETVFLKNREGFAPIFQITFQKNRVNRVVLQSFSKQRPDLRPISRSHYEKIKKMTSLKKFVALHGPGQAHLKFMTKVKGKSVLISQYVWPLQEDDESHIELMFANKFLVSKKILKY